MLDGPFRGTEALAAGLLTIGRLYGPRYRRIFPDVFVPAGLELDPRTRSRAAYLLVRERGGILGGYSAAAMLGAGCGPRDCPAEVLVPRPMRTRPGLRIGRAVPMASEVTHVAGCRVTTPLRTAWDLARRLSLVEAVVAVDALAHGGAFAPARLLELRTERPGARGARRLDAVVALADPTAESPQETRLRVGLIGEGLPRPMVQYRVRDEYGFDLARVDLAYPEAKLAIEYDGQTHFTRWQAQRDRDRDNLLADYGWHTMRLIHDNLIAIRQTATKVRNLLARRTGAAPTVTSFRFSPPRT